MPAGDIKKQKFFMYRNARAQRNRSGHNRGGRAQRQVHSPSHSRFHPIVFRIIRSPKNGWGTKVTLAALCLDWLYPMSRIKFEKK
jgi:hypothetical protein